MAEIVAIEIEARLLRWGDSSTAGRTITLELDPDAGERHPFRDYASGAKNGQRFRLLFAPIGDDEEPLKAGPVSEEAPARSLPQTPKPRNPDAADRARESYRADNEMGKAARRAGMLRIDHEYQVWLASRFGCNDDEFDLTDIKIWQRQSLGVESCSKIATDPEVYRRWDAHEFEFQQATGRAARPS